MYMGKVDVNDIVKQLIKKNSRCELLIVLWRLASAKIVIHKSSSTGWNQYDDSESMSMFFNVLTF